MMVLFKDFKDELNGKYYAFENWLKAIIMFGIEKKSLYKTC